MRFVFGLGEAGAFPAATRAMQLWFPRQGRGLVQGVTHCLSRLAVAVTPAIAIAIMTAFGWRWVFYVFAGIGVGWSVWFAAVYRNRPEEHHRVNPGELAHIREAAAASPTGAAAAVPWKAILRAPNMWAIAAAYFCFFYGAYFYLTWFPTYLLEYRHLSLKDVGTLASVPLIAAMIGDLAGGLLTDALLRNTGRLAWSRRIVAAPALLGAAVFLVPRACGGDRHRLSCGLEFLLGNGARASLGGPHGCRRPMERNRRGHHEHGRRRGGVDLATGVRNPGRARVLDRALRGDGRGALYRRLDLEFPDRRREAVDSRIAVRVLTRLQMFGHKRRMAAGVSPHVHQPEQGGTGNGPTHAVRRNQRRHERCDQVLNRSRYR